MKSENVTLYYTRSFVKTEYCKFYPAGITSRYYRFTGGYPQLSCKLFDNVRHLACEVPKLNFGGIG